MSADTIKVPVEFDAAAALSAIQQMQDQLSGLQDDLKKTGDSADAAKSSLSNIMAGLSLGAAIAGIQSLASSITDAATQADVMAGNVRNVHGHLVDVGHQGESVSGTLRRLQDTGHQAFSTFATNAASAFVSILNVNSGLHEASGSANEMGETLGHVGQFIGRVGSAAVEAGRFVVDGLRLIFETFRGFAHSGAQAIAGLFNDIIHGNFNGIGERFVETLGDVSAQTTQRIATLTRDVEASRQGIINSFSQPLPAPTIAPAAGAAPRAGGAGHNPAERAHQQAEEWAHSIEEEAHNNPDLISSGGVLSDVISQTFVAKFGEQAPQMIARVSGHLREAFQRDQNTIADTARTALERGLHEAVQGQGEAREGRAPSSDQADAIAHLTENRAALQRSIDADTAALAREHAVSTDATRGIHERAAAATAEAHTLTSLTHEREIAASVDNQARLNAQSLLSSQRTLAEGELSLLNEARADQAAGRTLTDAETSALSNQGQAIQHLTELHGAYQAAIAQADAELRRATVGSAEYNAILIRKMQLQQQDAGVQGEIRTQQALTTHVLRENTTQIRQSLDAAGEAMASTTVGLLENGKLTKQALEEALHAELVSLSQKGTIKALEMTATGLGDLAVQDYHGAAQAFTAAGAWTALAVAAGAGAAATNVSTSSSGGGGSGAPAAPVGASGSSNSQAGGSGGHSITINFSGAVIGTGGMASAGHQIIQAVNQANRQLGTQLNPGLLSGT